MITDNISLDIDGGLIYIADSREGFYFEVFDHHGTWFRDIRVSLNPRRVDDGYRNNALARLKSKSWWKQFENKLEPVFTEFFPEIRFFNVRDNRIFVQTYNEEGNNVLFRIYDLKNQKMSTVFLPRACDGAFKWYDIDKGLYYYLKENEETDFWELWVVTLKN